MIRFYGAENCPKCDAKKEELKEKGIEYAYADAKYIDINKDIDAKMILCDNNMELPVVYDTDTGNEV